MTKLEDLQPNAAVRGILPDSLVTVVSVQWFGSEAIELTYKTAAGKVANELLYRHDEPRIEIAELGRPWSFDGDGALFRLVSESRTCSTRSWRSTPRWWPPCRTRSRPSTNRCCRGNPSGSCWPTIPARARRSWPGC